MGVIEGERGEMNIDHLFKKSTDAKGGGGMTHAEWDRLTQCLCVRPGDSR